LGALLGVVDKCAHPGVEVLSPKTSLILAQFDLGESEAIAPATELRAEVGAY